MLAEFLHGFPPADWFALALFRTGGIGCGWYVNRAGTSACGLRGATLQPCFDRGRRMVRSENRIADPSLISNLVPSVPYCASMTNDAIADSIAIAGTIDRRIALPSELPHGRAIARELVAIKRLLPTATFILAYCKFTRTLGRFKFLLIRIGGAPDPRAPAEDLAHCAQKCSVLNRLSEGDCSRRNRAYCVGFAAGRWFVTTSHLNSFAESVLAVLWRRDFRAVPPRTSAD